MADVEEQENQVVPPHLRDPSHPGAARLGNGVGYLYPHDYPEGIVKQDYLPANVLNQSYYQPTDRGYEKEIRAYLKRVKQIRDAKE
jgi:putative ATPase